MEKLVCLLWWKCLEHGSPRSLAFPWRCPSPGQPVERCPVLGALLAPQGWGCRGRGCQVLDGHEMECFIKQTITLINWLVIPERLGDTASFLSGKASPVLMGSSKLFYMRCIITLILLLLPWCYITLLLFSLPQSSTSGKIIRFCQTLVWCTPKSLILIRRASPSKSFSMFCLFPVTERRNKAKCISQCSLTWTIFPSEEFVQVWMTQRYILWPCMAVPFGASAGELASYLLHLGFPQRPGLQLFNFSGIYLYCVTAMTVVQGSKDDKVTQQSIEIE